MTRADVKKAIKAKLEELSPFSEPSALLAVANNDVKPIDSYIEETMDSAFDKVLLLSPLHLIKDTVKSLLTTVTLTDGVGTVAAPADYLRLHTVFYPEWRRPVHVCIGESNPLYLLQRNPNTRGKYEKPVVAINNNTFEIYSLKAISDGTFKYIPKTVKNTATFEDSLVPLLVIQGTLDILVIFEQTEKAKSVTDELLTLLKLNTI